MSKTVQGGGRVHSRRRNVRQSNARQSGLVSPRIDLLRALDDDADSWEAAGYTGQLLHGSAGMGGVCACIPED
eukprot:scaffold34315_cov32-Tisochrysis_lutea.AAC.1